MKKKIKIGIGFIVLVLALVSLYFGTNSLQKGTLTVQYKPDLKVYTEVSRIGDYRRVRFIVKNDGNMPVPGFKFDYGHFSENGDEENSFWSFLNSNGHFRNSFDVPGMPPVIQPGNGYILFEENVPDRASPAYANNYTFFIVDPQNVIKESNESNNSVVWSRE